MFDSKKTGESTTTQKVEYPKYIEQAQQYGQIANLAQNAGPMSQVPNYYVAGLTEDQLMAGDLARQTARDVYNTDMSKAITGAAGAGIDALSGQMGRMAQVGGSDIQGMMNPYLEQVGSTTLDNMRREYENAQAGIAARYANEQAFGGSGGALARARLARDYNEGVGSTIANLQSNAWQQAQNAAFQNAQLENAAFARDAGLAGQAAGLGLQGSVAANSAYNDTIRRQMDAMANLNSIGLQSQQQAQRTLDVPWAMLQRYMSNVPQVQPNTSSSQPIYSNPFGTALGTAMTLWGGPQGSIFA